MSCSPATAPRARWRSSHVAPAEDLTELDRGGHRRVDPRAAQRLAEQGLDAGADTVGWHLDPPPRPDRLAGHHPPHPDPPRRWSSRPRERPRSSYLRFEATSPTSAGSPTSPTTASHRTGGRHRDHLLARRPLPLRAVRDRPPPDHRRDRGRHVRRRRCPARVPGLDPDRQRHGLHRPPGRPPRWTHRPGTRATPRSASSRRTADRTTPPPAARSNVSNRPSRTGCAPNPAARPPSPSSKPCSTSFVDIYNQQRPHRSLPHRATPAVAYAARPKATPGDRTTDTH